jgi:hypothetical protein
MTYLKELNGLHDQICYLSGNVVQKNGFKFIDVRIFDATEILDKDTLTILNSRIDNVKTQAELKLV